MDAKIKEKFLIKTEQSGRFIVKSKRTGIEYYVEPTGDPHTTWGDQDPVSRKLTGSYGKKYRGSIDKAETLIVEQNGFKNIVMLEPGMSPLGYIENIDSTR